MNLFCKIALCYVDAIKFVRITIINILTKCLYRNHNHYKKILINRDGAFGDSIVALPAISIVRQNYPSAQIDLLSVNNGGISFNHIGLQEGLIDNLYVITKKQRQATLKTLRKENYTLFIQLPQNIGVYKTVRNMLLVRFYLNIKSAFGWDHGRIKSFMRLQKKYLPIPTETERFINNLKKVGIVGTCNYPISANPPQIPVLKGLLKRTRPIVFIIGSKIQPKKWPLDNWVRLAKLIGDQFEIVISGGSNEYQEAEYITARTENTINVCGQLSLSQGFYLYKNSVLAISLDTGGMHLCDAAGTPLIALISTRELCNKWYPNHKESIVIEKVLPCSFCLKSVCADNLCMKNISADEVYAELSRRYPTSSSV